MVRRVRRLVALVALVALALPARAAGVDPSADGPYAVGVSTVTFMDASRSRTLVTEVWYPARSAGPDAPARRGRYPRVLVAHGYCGFRTNYEYLSVPLASWGFLVAAPDFPGINRADCDAGVPPGDIFGDPPRDLEFLRGAFHEPEKPTIGVWFAARLADPAARPVAGDDAVAVDWFEPAAPPPLAFPTDAALLARLARGG